MYEFYPEKFQEYTRLTTNQFDEVLELITPDIIKQNTNFRKSIPPRIRLLITLRLEIQTETSNRKWKFINNVKFVSDI